VHAQDNLPVLPGTMNPDSLKREMAKQKKAIAARFAKVQLTAMVTKVANNRFGYFIFADGQMLIEQNTIPAIGGNLGFVNEAESKRTADLAIKKMKEGEMPPSISVKELNKLKITGVNYQGNDHRLLPDLR
jgi:hypothetical protein